MMWDYNRYVVKLILLFTTSMFLTACRESARSGIALPLTSSATEQASSTSVPAQPSETPITPTSTEPPPTPTPIPPTATIPTDTPTSVPPIASIAPPSASNAGEIWIRPSDGMTMLYVPDGEFLMGSEEEHPLAHLDEQPQHLVNLDAYWIDLTEVTNAQYKICVESGICAAPLTCDYGDPTYSDKTKLDHPVVCVNWEEAGAYCTWVGGRLPSEAEWEKAARGTEALEYPWGSEFESQKCNTSESGLESTTPVGNYSPEGDSPYGLADMAGNVLEWVIDYYDIGYYERSTSDNPRGPTSGERRSLRGGSWYGDERNARTAYRYYNVPYGRSPGVGFRCVIPVRD